MWGLWEIKKIIRYQLQKKLNKCNELKYKCNVAKE